MIASLIALNMRVKMALPGYSESLLVPEMSVKLLTGHRITAKRQEKMYVKTRKVGMKH